MEANWIQRSYLLRSVAVDCQPASEMYALRTSVQKLLTAAKERDNCDKCGHGEAERRYEIMT